MKKLITMCVCIFTLTFFCSTNTGFSDILTDLQKFTESLGDVVTQISDLGKRISTLEKENASKDKQIDEYNQSMGNIEAHLKDLDDNVARVANMASLKGVKDIVKEFEGTLNVFKRRFAKLDNRVEDQEVKTAVLEKMYKAANQPLETLMQTLDEQKALIGRLEEKLSKQDTLISSMQDNLEKQTSLAESYGIEELRTRVGKLESGALVRSLTTHDGQGGQAPDKHATAHDDHGGQAPDKHAAAHDDHGGHVPDQHATTPGLIDIGEGFFIKNVRFQPFGSSSQISGEIMNKSEKDYGMIDFKFKAYDMENVPLGSLGFSIYGLKKGKVATFEEIIAGIEPKRIARYSIYPAQMPLVSDTGEKTVKIIDKELQTAKAETKHDAAKELAPENLEDLLFEETSPEKLAGLEDIGNGFYASNISFSGFGSSSMVTGKIKNNSREDFYSASFVMKIFSKEYGMLTSLDFSVRSIKSGDTETFEEIIAGVSPVDIDRYEIVFKSSY
jgi:uncharacterized coiled-coil protein SlyX